MPRDTRETTVARVAVADATRGYDREYDYTVPTGLAERAAPGMRALVPFGARDRERYAIILSLRGDDRGACESDRLKAVAAIPDSAPLLRAADIELAAFMREKYLCTWFDAFRCMLPKGWDRKSDRLRPKTVRGVRLAMDADAVREAITGFRVNREQQVRALEYLLARPALADRGVAVRRLADAAGVSESVIATLERNAYLARTELDPAEIADQVRNDEVDCARNDGCTDGADREGEIAGLSPQDVGYARDDGVLRTGGAVCAGANHRSGWDAGGDIVLTTEQTAAVAELNGLLAQNRFSETLLHGVTGSGKTEVYLRLIGRALELGRQAIVLVPEISLTPQMMGRFTSRFGGLVAIFHSGLTDAERARQWERVRSGNARIALGARSAVFAPLEDIGVIVVDEEHEASYKSEMTPRYHACEIARRRCAAHRAVLVYGSATPSVELYSRAVALTTQSVVKGGSPGARLGLITLRERANRREMPDVRLVDMRVELRGGNRGMFSRPLMAALAEALAERRQAILFLNRRGFASFLLCRDCGYIVSCRECAISYTYHEADARLVCHYCGLMAPVPRLCPACGSADIRAFGAGTERVEKEALRLFPGSRALRMDRDTTAGRGAHTRILEAFRDGAADILIGTQMIAKGHDFPNVTVVGVLAADAVLNFSDFRASERTFQLLTQVAGRSGRGDAPGRVVIQTYNPDHYSVTAARDHDYEGFYRQEMIAREALMYPPFSHIGVLLVAAPDDAAARAAAEGLYGALCPRVAEGGVLLAPSRPPVALAKNRYRWRLIAKHAELSELEALIRLASDTFYRARRSAAVELSADIDPFSMQ